MSYRQLLVGQEIGGSGCFISSAQSPLGKTLIATLPVRVMSCRRPKHPFRFQFNEFEIFFESDNAKVSQSRKYDWSMTQHVSLKASRHAMRSVQLGHPTRSWKGQCVFRRSLCGNCACIRYSLNAMKRAQSKSFGSERVIQLFLSSKPCPLRPLPFPTSFLAG